MSLDLRGVSGAINMLARGKRCPACGSKLAICRDDMAPWDTRLRLFAVCHGSIERVSVKIGAYDGPHDVVARIAKWLDGLFKVDCNPDVMELLRYNHAETR